jgi:hypothetical protein
MAANSSKDTAEYAKPASQVDLEERRANGNASNKVVPTADSYKPDPEDTGREFAVEGNDLDGYIGAGAEYQTYANETEAPLRAEDSVEEEVADEFVENTGQKGFADDGSDEDDESSSEETAPQSSAGQPPSSV